MTRDRGIAHPRSGPLDRMFYPGMALAAMVAVFIGFAPTYYLRPPLELPPLGFYLQLHGLAFSAWILLFSVQTTLVAAKRTDLHRLLGWAGALLAASMVIVGLTAAVISGRRNVAEGFESEALSFLTVPFSSMLVFLLLVAAAVRWRGQPQTHKRLMLLATISILDAAVGRWPLELITTTVWGYYAVTDVFIAIAIVYDVASHRRLHPAYLCGGLLILTFQVLRDPVGQTAIWQVIARTVLA